MPTSQGDRQAGANPDMASERVAQEGWSRPRDRSAPLVIAHRGASAAEPENSLAAFVRARVDGADGVELDVLQCATGEVVVFHDDDLARLGGRADRIAKLTLAELRAVRLLSGASIPTLEEALEACGDTLLVNVELKASGLNGDRIAALVDAVAALIDRAGARTAARILISSFSPRAVHRWRRRSPGVRTGLLFERDTPLPLRKAWALPWLAPFAAHPERVLCTAGAVAGWHRRGYRVHVWTVDEPAELRRLAALGVDGIITNHPARSRHILDTYLGDHSGSPRSFPDEAG